jgi:hypothetical protein
LTHLTYEDAYVLGRFRHQRDRSADRTLRTRRRKMAQGDWEVLISDITLTTSSDSDTYQANQATYRQEHPADDL